MLINYIIVLYYVVIKYMCKIFTYLMKLYVLYFIDVSNDVAQTKYNFKACM